MPQDIQIYTINGLKHILTHDIVSETPSHSVRLQVEPTFSKITVAKTLNSHACSGEVVQYDKLLIFLFLI